MSEPKTKDGAVFRIGMPLVTEAGVRFQTAGYELELADGLWALFQTGQDQGVKLNSFYSNPTARFADKLREARRMREFWELEEARFAEFVVAKPQSSIAEPN